MKIVHRPDGVPFVAVPNDAARDPRLSFKARGLLAAILSHQDGRSITADTLAAESPKEKRDAVRSGLAELEAAGYLMRERKQAERGQWETVVTVTAVPPTTANPSSAPVDNSGSPTTDNPAPVSGITAGDTDDGSADVGQTDARSADRRLTRPYREDQEEDQEGEALPDAPQVKRHPTQCDRHQEGPHDAPCWGCKRAREDYQAAEDERRRQTEERGRHAPECEEHKHFTAASCGPCNSEVIAGQRHPDDVGRIARRAS